MSGRTHEASWAVRLSAEVYRRLLLVFPATFRRQYGAHMVQVFRDCCREASHANGTVGLGRYWLIALGDLVVSAFAERRREEFSMSRATWIRLGSLAAIVGGVIVVLLQVPNFALLVTTLQGNDVPSGEDMFFQSEAWLATPVVWLLIIVALISLRAGWDGNAVRSVRIGTTLSIIGAALIGGGDAVMATVSRALGFACTPLTCIVFDIQNYSNIGRIAVYLGTILFACGMAAIGVAAVRSRVLGTGWINALPLAIGFLWIVSLAVVGNYDSTSGTTYAFVNQSSMGLLSALNIVFLRVDTHAAAFISGMAMQQSLSARHLVVIITANLIFALGWLMLGRILLRTGQDGLAIATGQIAPAAG